MKKLLNFVVIPVLATALTAMLTVTDASAKSGTRTFMWIAGDEAFFNPPSGPCDPACPDAAVAPSTGDTIEIRGQGVLTVHPKTIDGRGTFTATALEVGGSYVEGDWEAVQLLSFKSYGPGDPDDSETFGFPAGSFQAGLALIRIQLMVGEEWVADAILRLGCILPGAKVPGRSGAGERGGAIEGVRVNVQGGLNFNMEVDPRATLFIEMTP